MATQRKIAFKNSHFYHLYNRGIERKSVFTTKWEFQRALNILKYYRFKNTPLRFSKFNVGRIDAKLVHPEGGRTQIMTKMPPLHKASPCYAPGSHSPPPLKGRMLSGWLEDKLPQWSIEFVKKTGHVVNSTTEAKKLLETMI